MIKIHYKAYEIEEKLDIYFFHPLGALIAHIARSVPLTPNHLTFTSMALGVLGGALIYRPSIALWGVGFLVIGGIFDSADGQLARMQNNTTLQGRILDGMTGYLTFITIHLAILFYTLQGRTLMPSLLMLSTALLSGVSHSLQSCLYDFFRTQYVDYVGRRKLPSQDLSAPESKGFLSWYYQNYTALQKRLDPMRFELAQFLEKLYPSGDFPDKIVQAYKDRNLMLVKSWNLLGDNSRFLYLAIVIFARHLHWYFYIAVVPLNLILVTLLFIQARSDRRFLEFVHAESLKAQ